MCVCVCVCVYPSDQRDFFNAWKAWSELRLCRGGMEVGGYPMHDLIMPLPMPRAAAKPH